MSLGRDFVRDGERVSVRLKHLSGHRYVGHVGERAYELEARRLPDGRVRFQLEDGTVHEVDAARIGKRTQVRVDGRTWFLDRYEQKHGGHAAAANGVIEAPMTGTVLKLPVALGQDVEAGVTVVILSAMKMEHRLTAGIAGRVVDVAVREGETVDQGVVLLRIEAAGPVAD